MNAEINTINHQFSIQTSNEIEIELKTFISFHFICGLNGIEWWLIDWRHSCNPTRRKKCCWMNFINQCGLIRIYFWRMNGAELEWTKNKLWMNWLNEKWSQWMKQPAARMKEKRINFSWFERKLASKERMTGFSQLNK